MKNVRGLKCKVCHKTYLEPKNHNMSYLRNHSKGSAHKENMKRKPIEDQLRKVKEQNAVEECETVMLDGTTDPRIAAIKVCFSALLNNNFVPFCVASNI